MIKYLSLFSGIGAFEKAFENLGIDYELVGFSEIDKFAEKSYCAIHNIDSKLNLGDIQAINEYNLPSIDLISYGFPCQDISSSGQKQGLFNDKGELTRSGLFFEALRIIKYCQPKICIAENVKNLVSKDFEKEFNVILDSLEDAGYNNYWKVLNAKDFGIPQNRERVFIVSVRKDIDKGFTFPKKVKLKFQMQDFLEDEKNIKPKYYIDIRRFINGYYLGNALNHDSEDCIKRLQNCLNKSIAYTLMTSPATRRVGECNYITKDRKQKTVKEFLEEVENSNIPILEINKTREFPIDKEKLSKCISQARKDCKIKIEDLAILLGCPKTKVSHWFKLGKNFIIPDEHYWIDLKRILNIQTNEFDKSMMSFRVTEVKYENGKKNCIDKGITQSLDIPQSPVEALNEKFKIRALTPLECWRLMGFSDEDFYKSEEIPTSDTQLYKQAGNSIVVQVLENILKQLELYL